ncbi:hypothetical protein A2U01_0098012, partial [Trifolium medium]|nr:hypothetical protein [Trifolium medium]
DQNVEVTSTDDIKVWGDQKAGNQENTKEKEMSARGSAKVDSQQT